MSGKHLLWRIRICWSLAKVDWCMLYIVHSLHDNHFYVLGSHSLSRVCIVLGAHLRKDHLQLLRFSRFARSFYILGILCTIVYVNELLILAKFTELMMFWHWHDSWDVG